MQAEVSDACSSSACVPAGYRKVQPGEWSYTIREILLAWSNQPLGEAERAHADIDRTKSHAQKETVTH